MEEEERVLFNDDAGLGMEDEGACAAKSFTRGKRRISKPLWT